MPISSERFARANEVVEAGVRAANMCAEQGLPALDAHSALTDSLRADPLTIDSLLDLLGVALMVIALERHQRADW